MWYETGPQEQHTTLPALQKTRTTLKDRHYQAVFPKHTLKSSFKLGILISNRGDMDNKTGCSYAEGEEKTHPHKKKLRYLHKRIHIQTTVNAHTQQATAHKSIFTTFQMNTKSSKVSYIFTLASASPG